MSEVELVWIQECEVCGKEHQRFEIGTIDSLDQIEVKSTAFKRRCEIWYRAHVKLLMASQLGGATSEEAA